MVEPPLEPLAELLEADGGPRDQRRLLQEDLRRREGHRVHKRGRPLVGGPHLGEAPGVLVPPVHEQHRVEREGVRLHRRGDAVRALVARVEGLVPLHELAGVARRVEDDAGVDLCRGACRGSRVGGRGLTASAPAPAPAPAPAAPMTQAQRRMRGPMLDPLGLGLHEGNAVVDAAC